MSTQWKELKETFTSNEVKIISEVSALFGRTYDTSQHDSVYWSDIIEIDFEQKEINMQMNYEHNDKTWWALVGIASHYKFTFNG